MLAIYECSTDGVKKRFFKEYEEPLFVIVQQTVAATTDSPQGFGDIFAGEKYLYCLYEKKKVEDLLKGEKNSAYIFLYGWDGKPVKSYSLEKPLFAIGVDEKSGILYGIGYDPEACIFEYKL